MRASRYKKEAAELLGVSQSTPVAEMLSALKDRYKIIVAKDAEPRTKLETCRLVHCMARSIKFKLERARWAQTAK